MTRPVLIIWVFALVFYPTRASGATVSEQLIKLDELRLKNSMQFSLLLRDLDAELASNTIDPKDKQYLALLKAYDFTAKGDFETALDILENYNFQGDNHTSLRIQGLKVNIYVLSYRYTEAFINLEPLLNALPTLTNALDYYQLVGQAIMLFNNIERYDISQQLVDQGLWLSNDDSVSCRLTSFRLQGDYKTTKFDTYITKFNDASRLCEMAGETLFHLLITRNHMFYLLEQQQFSPVLALYQRYITQVSQINYPLLTAGFKAAAAEALLQQGEIAIAASLAAEAEQSLPADRHDPAVLATYRVQYMLAKTQGSFQNLLHYGEKRRDTELTIAREKSSQQLAYQLANNAARLKEQRIQLLDKDNELLTLERNLYQQQSENRYLFLILISSLTLLLAALSYRNLTRSKRFRRLAEFDQLTGISNRHHFYQQASIAAKYCEQNQRPLSVVAFDLDYFKKINDTYGHAMGDWALQQVVACCRNFMRNSDIFGRVGGEEFAIVLPDCTADKAEMLAEICRDAIAGIDTSQFSSPFTLTASFGVSEAAQSGYDISALLDSADKALYKAKDNGRNQVWCSD